MLFRGKTQECKWVYWNEYGELITISGKRKSAYAYHRTKNSISYYHYVWQLKDSKLLIEGTVGQFIGLMDCNDQKIFSDDICMYDDKYFIVKRECDVLGGYWAETGYLLKERGYESCLSFTDTIDDYSNRIGVIVVSNIHDRPDLMRV